MKRLNQSNSLNVQDWEKLMWNWIILEQNSPLWEILPTAEHIQVKGDRL